jgi:beta-lactamase class D
MATPDELRDEMRDATMDMMTAATGWFEAFVNRNEDQVAAHDAWHTERLRDYRRAERKLRKLLKKL